MKLKRIFVGVKDFIAWQTKNATGCITYIDRPILHCLPFLTKPDLKKKIKRYIRYLLCTRSSISERGDVDKENHCVMIIKSHSKKLTQSKKKF